MVRLALGSDLLSTPEDPAVAVLDDPLTHNDVVRLDRMRGIAEKCIGRRSRRIDAARGTAADNRFHLPS